MTNCKDAIKVSIFSRETTTLEKVFFPFPSLNAALKDSVWL